MKTVLFCQRHPVAAMDGLSEHWLIVGPVGRANEFPVTHSKRLTVLCKVVVKGDRILTSVALNLQLLQGRVCVFFLCVCCCCSLLFLFFNWLLRRKKWR